MIDDNERRKLIKEHMYLVEGAMEWDWVKEFGAEGEDYKFLPGLDDLSVAGKIGLAQAAKLYLKKKLKEEKNFIDYARWFIKQSIRRVLGGPGIMMHNAVLPSGEKAKVILELSSINFSIQRPFILSGLSEKKNLPRLLRLPDDHPEIQEIAITFIKKHTCDNPTEEDIKLFCP